MRNLPGFSPMRLALVLTGGFFVVVVVVAVLATRSGGNDAQTASNVTTPAEKRPVKVVITAGTEFAGEEQTDGGIAGLATFKASGAITDQGTDTTYRKLTGPDDSVILLRYVTKGKKGAISYMVKIDTTRRPVRPRWWIESATGAYKGLQGKGDESENATYTVSTLTGRVWR